MKPAIYLAIFLAMISSRAVAQQQLAYRVEKDLQYLAPERKEKADLYGPASFADRPHHAMFGKTQAEAPELYRQASPITHATGDDPPMLILHGTADKTVPVAQSELMADALKKAGVIYQLEIVPDAPHTFHLQPKQRDLRPLVLGFFDRYLKSKS